MWAYRPRWCGSHELMLAFGRACLDTRRFDTAVPACFDSACFDIAGELTDWRPLFQKPEVARALNNRGRYGVCLEDSMEGKIKSIPPAGISYQARNQFRYSLQGDRVSVEVNGQKIFDRFKVESISDGPSGGMIGFSRSRWCRENITRFRNLAVRRLEPTVADRADSDPGWRAPALPPATQWKEANKQKQQQKKAAAQAATRKPARPAGK